MKKLVALILAAIMVIALVGCATTPAETPAAEAAATEAPAEATASEEAATEDAAAEETTLDYPTRAIEIAVPYGAGGGQDVFTRITVKYMLKYMEGANIVVNNVTGGGGVIGATYMATSPNDGYYMGSIVPWQLTDQFVMNEIPYDENSFVPVGVGSYDCNFLVISPKLGIDNFADFIQYVKDNPGEVTIGMGGNWNVHDFFRLKLEKALGIKFARVSYDGGAAALTAVMNGDIDCASNSISEALSAMDAGQVIAICASSPERVAVAPDVPTLIELGVDMTHGQWRCLTVPAGTDQAIQDYLAAVLDKVYSDPEWITECEEAGLAPVNYTGDAAKQYVADDFEVLKSLIEELGITPDFEL